MESNDFKRNILSNKKYLMVYLVGLIILSLSIFYLHNYLRPKMELSVIICLAIFGTVSLVYFFQKPKEIHRMALIVIILFGILLVFLNPVSIVCDEIEHFSRADMTSQGILVPEYVNESGFVSSGLVYQILDRSSSSFPNGDLEVSIDNSKVLYNGAFPQNPFYGYIFSGLGILIAKLLDLTAIWAFRLGRLFNLIAYALICSFSIKKAPKYKIPLFVVACLPMSIYQAASFSIDGLICAFAILAVAYFVKMYDSEIVETKDVGMFFFAIVLFGMFKSPYALLSFLIFFIPNSKFKSRRTYLISRIVPFIILAACCLFNYYGATLLEHTLRKQHFINDHVNYGEQLNFVLTHFREDLVLIGQLPNFISFLSYDLFRFGYLTWIYTSSYLGLTYTIFFVLFSLFYPIKIRFGKNKRIVLLVMVSLIFLGIVFIQYLSWAPVGYMMLDEFLGVYARYFIPLLLFLPLIFNFPKDKITLNIENLDLKVVVIVLLFLAGVIILTTCIFY